MKQTLSILTHRWKESLVLLILMLLYSSTYLDFNLGAGFNSFIRLPRLIIAIVLMVLATGFVRSAYLHDATQQSLESIWNTGWQFFLRVVGVNVCCVLAGGLIAVIPYGVWLMTTSADIEQTDLQLSLFMSTAAIILLKVNIYMVPIILAQDCGIRDAWKMLRNIRFAASYTLIGLLVLCELLDPVTCLPFSFAKSSWTLALLNFADRFLEFLIWLGGTLVAGNILGAKERSTNGVSFATAN